MEGRLLNKSLSVEVKTRCHHCRRALRMTIDSEMRVTVREPRATPWVFMPDVNWANFPEPTIIDSY